MSDTDKPEPKTRRVRKTAEPAAEAASTTSASPAKSGKTRTVKTSVARSKTKAKAPAAKTNTKSAPTAPELDAEAKTLVAPEAALPVQGVTREAPEQEVAAEVPSDTADVKLLKKELIQRVVARSGAKPRHVRQVTDALLEELGAMLDEADTLQLQPLGTVKVQRRRAFSDGGVVVCKVRRKKPGTKPNDPLAAAAE